MAAELTELRAKCSEHSCRATQLEGALITARAEAVLLRRLLELTEHLRAEDIFTLEQIEQICAMRGYAPDGGQPLALWVEATLRAVQEAT